MVYCIFCLHVFDTVWPFKLDINTNKNNYYVGGYLSHCNCKYFFGNLRLSVLIKGIPITGTGYRHDLAACMGQKFCLNDIFL